jgi:predicted transglutaminase-like protease
MELELNMNNERKGYNIWFFLKYIYIYSIQFWIIYLNKIYSNMCFSGI